MNIGNFSHNFNKAVRCFNGVYITRDFEIVFDRQSNIYFRLEGIETEAEFTYKMIEWLSRPCTKDCNKNKQKRFLTALNEYLDTSFTHEQMSLIYTKLGNNCNRGLTALFVGSGYNLEVLKIKAEKETNE